MTTETSLSTLDASYRPMNGAFKGRGRNYAALLACPIDGARLEWRDGDLICTRDAAHHYPQQEGILRLVPAERRAVIEAISAAHEAACAERGWEVPDEAAFKSLPQTGLAGYDETYWPQQAAGTALLWRFLEAIRRRNGGLPVGPAGEAAVVSAGMGWLAYGLDVAGYTTLAIDALAGPRYGLGVYPIARYCRVQADPIALPLAPGALDWVIFQEGLISLGDDDVQQQIFVRAIRALRPGGWVAVMDVLAPSENGVQEVHARFEDAGLVLLQTPRRNGWRGRFFELRDRLARREPGVPPVLVAQKPAAR